MLTCSACGHEEPEGSRFCGGCGTPFPPDDPQSLGAATVGATSLHCESCGAEEPEGARFCGTCGTPFPAAEPRAADPTPIPLLASEASSPPPADAHGSPVGSGSASLPPGARRRRWIAVGVAGLLLVAGIAFAAVLSMGGDDSTAASSTVGPSQPDTASESSVPLSPPTLVAGVSPSLQEIATAQGLVNGRITTLRAGVESFAALRQAADSLAADIVETEGIVAGLAPIDDTEVGALEALRSALASHLAYARAISALPALPRSFTSSQAQEAIARAEQAQLAYTTLAATDPALPTISLSSSDHVHLLTVVPAPKPPPASTTVRSVDLAPLLVGPRPDDPAGAGRCFGPYTARASLRVSGVTHHSGFVQCGDGADGEPSRASGEYRFSGSAFTAESRFARLTGQVAIDESSSPSQQGSSVTWTVSYDGTPICSETVVWSGRLPLPTKLDCTIPAAASSVGPDLGRLRIQQSVSLASTGSFWAGLLDPTIVVETSR